MEELIDRLERALSADSARVEEEARRAEDEARRAEDESAKRADIERQLARALAEIERLKQR